MSKTSYICNCDVIHEDIVNDVKSKMQPVSYTHLQEDFKKVKKYFGKATIKIVQNNKKNKKRM